MVYFDQRPGLNKFPGRPSYQQGSNNGCLGTRFDGFPMCDKCGELDKKIEHYRQMLLSIGDQTTVERIKVLIEGLQAQKAALHPEQKP